ncbi:MAG: LysE family translocator [Anaerolineales bacterium]
MFALFAQGLTLGFSASVSPGPFLAYLLSHTLNRGARRTLPLTLTPLASDGPIIALVLLVLTQTPDWFLRGLKIAGGLFLIYLAYGALQTARRMQNAALTDARSHSFADALLMNTINPNPWIFWSAVGGPILLEGWALSASHAFSFGIGFYLALIGGMVGFVVLFATAHRLDPRLTRALNYVAAIALLGFGLWQLWRGVMGA